MLDFVYLGIEIWWGLDGPLARDMDRQLDEIYFLLPVRILWLAKLCSAFDDFFSGPAKSLGFMYYNMEVRNN